MKPVRTSDCNVVYKGPRPDVGDLWCHRVRPGVIRTAWEPSEEERELIVQGGRIFITFLKEPIPPVMVVGVSKESSEPIAEHGWKIDVEPGDELPKPEAEEEEDNGEEINITIP